jgi:hypothetical protein
MSLETRLNPGETDLFAGIARARIEVESFDLGEGVRLSQTYAHFTAPFLLAFKRAAPGKLHPAPWKAAKGGFAFDIETELFAPVSCGVENRFDHLNTIWWIAALLRLRGHFLLSVPMLSCTAFTEVAASAVEPEFWPMEVEPGRLRLTEEGGSVIPTSTLEWVRDNWVRGAELMDRYDQFNQLFQAFDGSPFSRSPSIALLTLWGAMESMFSPARNELRFRVSALIATYLEPPGDTRQATQKKLMKLYDSRSSAAHGGKVPGIEPARETYVIAKRIIERVLETGSVPSPRELEARLFGSP